MHRAAVVLLALGLSACAVEVPPSPGIPPGSPPSPGASPSPGSPPSAGAPPSVSLPPNPGRGPADRPGDRPVADPPGRPPLFPPVAGDPCGARAHQALIGRNVSAIQGIAFPGRVRVIRPGEPITEDFSPTRTNVVLDRADRIVEISCG